MFHLAFVFVHSVVRSLEHVGKTAVLFPVKSCKTTGNADGNFHVPFFHEGVLAAPRKLSEKLFVIFKITVLQNRQKFVTADTEYGISLEQVRNHLGSRRNELISEGVTVAIVGFLQFVQVKYDDAEIGFFLLDFSIEFLDPKGPISSTFSYFKVACAARDNLTGSCAIKLLDPGGLISSTFSYFKVACAAEDSLTGGYAIELLDPGGLISSTF